MSLPELGERYGLSPATLAGLAAASGQSSTTLAPVTVQGTPTINAAPVEYSPDELITNEPEEERELRPGETYGDLQNRVVKGGTESGLSEEKHGLDPKTMLSTDATEGTGERHPEEEGGEGTPQAMAVGRPVQAAPSVTIPAHWQPGTHSVALSRGMSPEELRPGQEEREIAFGKGYSGSYDHLRAAQERGLADAVQASAHAYMSQRTANAIANINARKQQYVEDQRKKLEDLSLQAQKTEDPNALFKERGTLGSILTGVMIGMGQFAQIWSGRGSNAALDITNEQINRNVAAQRANIANAHRAYDTASSLFDKNLAAFGDEERAAIATKVQYLDGVIALADAQRVKAGMTEAEATQNDYLKGLYNERAKYEDDFAKATHTQVNEQENESFKPAQTIGGGGAATKREGNLVTTADGTTYHFGNEKMADKATERLQAFDDVQYLTNRILAVRKKTMGLDPLLDRTKYESNMLELKKLDDNLAQAESSAAGQGVVTKEDTARRKGIGLDATAGLGTFKGGQRIVDPAFDSANHAFKAAASDSTHRGRSFVRTAGGEIYERDYARDAAGNLVPTGRFTGQDVKPAARLAPRGSKAMDPRDEVYTDDVSDRETTPHAPVRAGVVAPAPASGGGKSKGGKGDGGAKTKRR